MELLAFTLAGLWSSWLMPVLLLVGGLGMVIFVHELGHLLAAKLVGIKVERFALGFGPRLFGVKFGETDYCVSLLPLGGYVKMLGQEDIAPLKENETDPRAFSSKSVGARFVVIAAGVVMNVVFAAVLIIAICMVGIRFVAPVVGGVMPDFPAAEARITWQPDPAAATGQPHVTTGLKGGDRILDIDTDGLLMRLLGTKVERFFKLQVSALLADPDDKFTMKIERMVDGHKRLGTAQIGVKPLPGGTKLGFGIMAPIDPVFGEAGKTILRDQFHQGDRVVAVNDNKVRSYEDMEAVSASLTGRPVTVTIEREGQELKVQVQPVLKKLNDENLLSILGMIPRLKILGVEKGSPADDAHLAPGDIIVGYGDMIVGDGDRVAPTRLEFLEINARAVDGGTNIIVVRDGKELPAMQIVPKSHDGRPLVGLLQTIDQANTVIASVREDSPAERAGIMAGDVIEKVNGREVESWIDVFDELRRLAGKAVEITLRRSTRTITARIGELNQQAFDPQDYAFELFATPRGFVLLLGPEIKKGPLSAIAWGWSQTMDFVVMTYGSLRSLIKGTVSHEEMTGPVGIGRLAIQAGRKSLVHFVHFMAIISVSIAVINFLPIPVVDGGHAVFLLIEKIRGRPLPVRVMNITQMIGLVLIALVFIAVTFQDILKWWNTLW